MEEHGKKYKKVQGKVRKQIHEGAVWQKKLAASYSVEASYIMAITLLALSVLIRNAYAKYAEETNIMWMHHIVEQFRGREMDEEDAERKFGGGEWNGMVTRNEKEVEGVVRGGQKEKEIQARVHEPEEMMRMMTIFQAGGEPETTP